MRDLLDEHSWFGGAAARTGAEDAFKCLAGPLFIRLFLTTDGNTSSELLCRSEAF